MPEFRLICRAVLEPAVVAELGRRGIYYTTGGPTHISAPTHKRHQLVVDADDEVQAIEIARAAVREAGGNASDISTS